MKCFNIIDAGYMPLVRNQLKNFSLDYMKDHELNIYCLDKTSFELCQQMVESSENIKLHSAASLMWDGNAASYGDEKFKKLMRLRPKMFLEIVRSLGDSLHTEADVFWFQDPLNVVPSHPNCDWLIQHDGAGPNCDIPWLNIGCAFYRDTLGSIRLFEKWIEHHDNSSLLDQEALHELLNMTVDKSLRWPSQTHADYREACRILEVNVDCFNKTEVQNGCNAFKEGYIRSYKPVAVHANHHTGIETKISLLKSCGGWL